MDSDSHRNLNELIEYSKTDKLTDSIAKLISTDYCTGFFIKLEIDSEELPFFCTSKHGLDAFETKISLVLNKKENGKNIQLNLDLNKKNRKIKYCSPDYDTVFIQIMPEEIPQNIALSFLELK